MSQHPFALYNPALLPPEVLLGEFTARRPMLETLLGVVRGNKPRQPPQHVLIIGPRGSGKTTLLWAVAHRVRQDSQLSAQWQPVVFDEESRRVGDLADFWLEAIRQLEHEVGSKDDSAGRLLVEAAPDIEERARKVFLELVERGGKRALLLIDNLNDLLGSIHDAEPLHRLRAFLMKESSVMVVGAATRYFDEITQVDRPFYDFFRYFELRPLSFEEMKECVDALAKSHGDAEIRAVLEQRSGTVQALHLLTGGNPRLIKTFYRLLREGLHGDIRRHLERLLDESTPYFKAIVDALPGQQQRIFDAVALAWDPVEVASIATTTRLPSNQVSAQLKQLLKTGLVHELPKSPRKKAYLLADRFSNIHYLMRHGRAARNRFDWFVALVRLVFPDREATEVLARTAQDAAEHGPDGELDARAVLHSALLRAESAESRKALLHATIRQGWDQEARDSLNQWFDDEQTRAHLPEVEIVAFCRQMPAKLRKELGYKPESPRWWVALTDFLEEKCAYSLAESAYRKAIELDPHDGNVWAFLGSLLLLTSARNGPLEAERACRKAVELQPRGAFNWLVLGFSLECQEGKNEEAITAYRNAVENAPEIATHQWFFADALFRRDGGTAEARRAAIIALRIAPENSNVRQVFAKITRWHAEDWREALPLLAAFCLEHPDDQDAYDYTVGGYLQLAALTSPSDARAALDVLADASPFETLRDALIAHDDREHLQALAPERRSVAIELLKRLAERTEAARAHLSAASGAGPPAAKPAKLKRPRKVGRRSRTR